jgi:Skp family chaperone for outer membrane proteins
VINDMSYKLKVTSYKLKWLKGKQVNRLKLFTLLPLFLFTIIIPCSAQSKFGHIDYSEIMKNMPGIDSAQTIVSNYYADLQTIGEQMAKELKEKETAYENLMNNPNTSQAVLKIKQDELTAMYRRFQEFSQSAEGDLRDKQIEVLEPFQNQLLDDIKLVAKAGNYSYIFDISTLLFSSSSDDLTNKVKAELGIKK